jgi:hypothetical protein
MNGPGLQVIKKAIELDVTFAGIADDQTRDRVRQALRALSTRRSAHKIGELFSARDAWTKLKRAAVKVEFPNFDKTIVDTANPPADISRVVDCVTAATTAAFNQLPTADRTRMGMYRRKNKTSFDATRAPDPRPRTAP